MGDTTSISWTEHAEPNGPLARIIALRSVERAK